MKNEANWYKVALLSTEINYADLYVFYHNGAEFRITVIKLIKF